MLPRRVLVLRIVLLAAFVAFLGQLAILQLVRGDEFRVVAQRNHLRLVRLPAPRGRITDRKGVVLAKNTPAMRAWLIPSEVPKASWDNLLQQLVTIGIYADRAEADAALGESRRTPSYYPTRLGSDLTMAQVTRLEEAAIFLPGVYLRAEPVRAYPSGTLAPHLLGYLREIDADEYRQRRGQGYRPGDRIGKSGLEQAYEDQLRGQEGSIKVEVDVHGRVVATAREYPPAPGATLALTLDNTVQTAAEAGLRGHVGAAVALDPATGDILALASAPAYDANLMSGRLSPAVWHEYRAKRALIDRVCERYPPGSVFKIVTAATALEAGKVTSNSYFFCNGVYRKIHCWQRRGHGALNLTEAIAQSCNVAFMHMAENVGITPLAKMAHRFGLGEPLEVTGLPMKTGLVPDLTWAKKRHLHWNPGDTLQVGIGQSYMQITPLQGARIAAAMANGGALVTPRLVKQIDGVEQPVLTPEPLGLKSSTREAIRRGLRAVVGEGTARSLDPTLHIAGKTGTAQNPGLDHAWFVGYAPADHPSIAVAVLIEHGGHGGAVAAPIAERIIKAYLVGPETEETETAASAAQR
jgi:penicillin-binding protein 2